MSNSYCTRYEVKQYLGIAQTESGDDALLDALCERVSRLVDSPTITGFEFFERVATYYFDYYHSQKVRFNSPLLEVTTFTSGGSVQAASTFRLLPRNSYPKSRLELITGEGGSLSYSSTPQDAHSILGLWGYHDDPTKRWADSGDTIQNATQISASGTTLTVADGDVFQVGHTLRIGTEQLCVSAILTNDLTVARAENGTTAAIHLNGVAVYIYRPMQVIREATRELVCQMYKMKDSIPWGRIEMLDIGMIQVQSGIPELAERMLAQYRRIGI